MILTCERCGTEFDTDREVETAGATTTRCPSCGRDHDVDALEPDGAGDGAASVTVDAGDGLQIRLDVQLHVHLTEGNA